MFHPYEGEPSASLRRRTECIPTKENRVHQTKISTKTDKDGFSPAVFRSRLEHYWMFSLFILLRLCFVFYGEIYVKNG